MMGFIYTLCGIIGNVLFAGACIQAAWNAMRTGKVATPRGVMWTFFCATVTFGIYLFGEFGFHWLFFCLSVETISWGVVIRFSYWPERYYVEYNDDTGFYYSDDMSYNAALIFARKKGYGRRAVHRIGTGPYVVGMCIRTPGHSGACNGYPRPTCFVWDDALKMAHPLKDHRKPDESLAAYIYRINGPCTPQCTAECDGVCAAVGRARP